MQRPIGVIVMAALLAALVYSQRHMFIKGLADAVHTGPSFEELLREAERLYEARDLAGAEAAFEQAMSKRPEDPGPYAYLGLIRSEQGDFDGALRRWEQAVERAPEEVGYRVNLGKAYAQLGRREAAVAQWQKALEINPYHDTARELIRKEASRDTVKAGGQEGAP